VPPGDAAPEPLYQKYGASGFVLLSVNVDDDTRNAADVAAKLGVTFPVLWDTDKKVSRCTTWRRCRPPC
jgi:peroxiredoxin